MLISITTLDRELAAAMEPRASGPAMRLRAIHTLADAGIPVGVSVERGCAPMWLRPTSAAGNLVSWSWGFESVVGRISFFIDFQIKTHVRYPPIRRPILKHVDVSYSRTIRATLADALQEMAGNRFIEGGTEPVTTHTRLGGQFSKRDLDLLLLWSTILIAPP